MIGSGCEKCPVKPCETLNYRGSTCSAQRARYGLGDPQTNGDLIRAMNDEELAKFLDKVSIRCPRPTITEQCSQPGGCKECVKSWLQQSAEEVNDDTV